MSQSNVTRNLVERIQAVKYFEELAELESEAKDLIETLETIYEDIGDKCPGFGEYLFEVESALFSALGCKQDDLADFEF